MENINGFSDRPLAIYSRGRFSCVQCWVVATTKLSRGVYNYSNIPNLADKRNVHFGILDTKVYQIVGRQVDVVERCAMLVLATK